MADVPDISEISGARDFGEHQYKAPLGDACQTGWHRCHEHAKTWL